MGGDSDVMYVFLGKSVHNIAIAYVMPHTGILQTWHACKQQHRGRGVGWERE